LSSRYVHVWNVLFLENLACN